jgi:Asp-tRNA(Asn)/Glu-tRNA(Gln) amidotransferase C subunit
VKEHFHRIERDFRDIQIRFFEILNVSRGRLTEDEKEIFMAALDDMTTAVAALEAASAEAIREISTLKSADNETALEALVTRVGAVTSALTAAAPPPA